jgi:hypothetical protein
MKKFVFLYGPSSGPENDSTAAWSAWFEEVGSALIDGGNPLGEGWEVTGSGVVEVRSEHPVTGYSLVAADSLDAAKALAARCTLVEYVQVYEAFPM